MKQVTIDTVRERIAELNCLRGDGVLSLRGEFELACLRQLVASMEAVPAVELKGGKVRFLAVPVDGVLYRAPVIESRYAVGIDPYMSNAACLREINEALGGMDITMFSQVATGINDMKSAMMEAAPVVVIPTIWKHYGGGKVAHLYEQAMDAAGVKWRSVDDEPQGDL